MFITHSYLGTSRAPYRCLFFLLLEDYIEAQTQFVRELDLYLERFARRLGDAGALVRPFASDIEKTRQQILDKGWSEAQKSEIYKTPSLLMIDQDFDAFDPQLHYWIQLHLGHRMQKGVQGVYEFGTMLDRIADAVVHSDKDIFRTAHKLVHEVRLSEALKIFEARPGIFGFSVDLVKGVEIIGALCRKLAGSRPRNV